MMRRRARLGPGWWRVAFAPVLMAVLSAGTVEAQIATDGTAGPAQSLSGPSFSIPADLGAQAGGNLFHSFSQFNIGSGESATFSGPASVSNILARVTGGSASAINGTLSSTIPGAGLYLINPNGISFGPGAFLNVQGAFHASTADYITHQDGARFAAAPMPGASFSAAPPAAFGFLGSAPAAISFSNGFIAPAAGAPLSVVAGAISLIDTLLITLDAGIELSTVGQPGELPIGSDGGASPLLGGDITLTNGDVLAQGTSAQRVVIRGGKLVMDAASRIEASVILSAPGMDIVVDAAEIDITGGAIQTISLATGPPGDITVTAGTITLRDGAAIESDDFSDFDDRGGDLTVTATGDVLLTDPGTDTLVSRIESDGGAVSVTARNLTLDSTEIESVSFFGDTGDITINVETLNLLNGSELQSRAFAAAQAGDVLIDATASVSMSGRNFDGERAVISSSGGGSGQGGFSGRIVINAASLTVDDGEISAPSFFGGAAGDIEITVSTLTLSGTGFINSSGAGAGEAGDVRITASDMLTMDQALITSISSGSGAAGNVVITAGAGTMKNQSVIASSAGGTGAAGNVVFDAASLDLDASAIFSNTFGPEDAGDVTISAGTITIANTSRIDGSTFGAGRGGDVTVTATESIRLFGRLQGLEQSSIENSTSGAGAAGSVIVAAPSIELDDATIFSRSTGSATGNAGAVAIDVGTLTLKNGGVINTSTGTVGAGGTIVIDATGAITLSGRNALGEVSRIVNVTEGPADAGNITVTANVLTLDDGTLSNQTDGSFSGNAGDMSLAVGTLNIINGGLITNRSLGASNGGNAGRLTITATAAVNVTGRDVDNIFSQIENSTAGSGNAGDVVITAPVLFIDDSSLFSDTLEGASGDAGSITLNVGDLTLNTGSSIDSSTAGTGAGGTITINATGMVTISGQDQDGFQAAIRSASDLFGAGAGKAGNVTIIANALVIDDGIIATDTVGGGAGGAVTIDVGMLQIVNGGSIDTSTFAEGGAGTVDITAGSVTVTDTATISSSSEGGGAGGTITISAGDIALTGGGSIKTTSTGAGLSGDIAITVSGGLRMNDGAITTEAAGADGGRIAITGPGFADVLDSRITSTVAGFAGNGGDILVSPRLLVLTDGRIQANAVGGNGGNLTIDVDSLLQKGQAVIEATSELGISGTVEVSAPDADVSGALAVLPSGFSDPAAQLAAQCDARGGRTLASFVGEGRGGLPVPPGGPHLTALLGDADGLARIDAVPAPPRLGQIAYALPCGQ